MGRIIVVRHGESEGNAAQRFTENDRVPLTALGRQQALVAAAEIAARFAPVRIVSSPFRRAEHTAEIISELLRLPVELEAAVREQDLGELHGQPYAAARALPHHLGPLWQWRPPAGETLVEVQTRAAPVIDQLARQHATSDVLVVCHGGTTRALWSHVTGDWAATPAIPNCAIVVMSHRSGEFAEPELVTPDGSAPEPATRLSDG